MSDTANINPPQEKPAPAKKRHIGRTIGIIALIIVVLVIVTNATKGSSNASSSSTVAPSANGSSAKATTAPAASAATTVATPGIGTKVYDGDFAFVVNSVTCGASAAAAVNDNGIGETIPAGAQECLVNMTVSNDKSQAQTFFDSSQYAYDAQNHQFSADTSGSVYISGDQDGTQINPGVTISAVVPYQIPANDSITKLVLHDSDFSSGVTVAVK